MPHNLNLEAAWAAGFFDGEGSTVCSGARNPNETRSLSVSVGQLNKANLDRFVNAVGCGKVYGPYNEGGRVTPIFRYRVYGALASGALRVLWPFLGEEKQTQALKAMIAYSFRRLANGHFIGSPKNRPRAIAMGVGIRIYKPGPLCRLDKHQPQVES